MEKQDTSYAPKSPDEKNFSFTGKIHFANFNRSSSMMNKAKGYYPIAVTAMCTYPQDPSKFYHCLYFFDLTTATAQSHLQLVRVHTSHPPGVFTLDEAYGITSNRTDGADGSPECVICLTETKNVINKPCKHVCMCYSCAKAVISSH